MSGRLRIVLDTNVLVSAMLSSRSAPGRAVRLAARAGDLLISAATSREVEEVFHRPKFDGMVSLAARAEFLFTYRAAARMVQVDSHIQASRDECGDKFLELAVDGHADLIVSGDEDLLALHPYCGMRILTPQQFLYLANLPG
jgi:putative PIN family toxin of toxin-antitoxin system